MLGDGRSAPPLPNSAHSPVALSSADRQGCVLRGPGGLESLCASQLLQGLPWWRGTSAIILVPRWDQPCPCGWQWPRKGQSPHVPASLSSDSAALAVSGQLGSKRLAELCPGQPDPADQAPLRSLPPGALAVVGDQSSEGADPGGCGPLPAAAWHHRAPGPRGRRLPSLRASAGLGCSRGWRAGGRHGPAGPQPPTAAVGPSVLLPHRP